MHVGDSLLYVLSGRPEMKWAEFKRVVACLRAQEASSESAMSLASRVARLLDALGHIEFVNRNGTLSINTCPPSLVRLPNADVRAVLAGSRSPAFLESVSQIAANLGIAVSLTPHEGVLGSILPCAAFFTSGDARAMEELATAAHLAYSAEPPSAALAQFAASLADVSASWKWRSEADLNWEKSYLDPETGQFRRDPTQHAIRMVRYKDPKKTTFRYWVWNELKNCEVDRDWGRLWVLNKLSYPVFFFNRADHTFIQPENIALPKILARAIFLCSGESPIISRPRAVHRNVPRSVALVVTGKVGQLLNEFHSSEPWRSR